LPHIFLEWKLLMNGQTCFWEQNCLNKWISLLFAWKLSISCHLWFAKNVLIREYCCSVHCENTFLSLGIICCNNRVQCENSNNTFSMVIVNSEWTKEYQLFCCVVKLSPCCLMMSLAATMLQHFFLPCQIVQHVHGKDSCQYFIN